MSRVFGLSAIVLIPIVTLKSRDPEEAAEIANAIAHAVPALAKKLS